MRPDDSAGRPAAESARRSGFRGLFAWACLGLALETAHGFKLAWVLDDALRREWLRWGHAHGVGLSLLLLLYAAVGGSRAEGPNRTTLRWLTAAAWLLPLGFCLGALWHYESDPGAGILLAPLGGACLLLGLGRAAREVSGA